MATDPLNQRLHLQGESCLKRRDWEAKIPDFYHSAGSILHPPPSLPPSLHQPALLGFVSLDFPANRRLLPPQWFDGGGCEGPCCNPVPHCCWISSDDVCIPLPLEPAGGGSPGWTGRVVLLRGGLPALRHTAWGGQRKMNKRTLQNT